MKTYWTSFSLAYESSRLCATILPINDSVFTYLFRKAWKKKKKKECFYLFEKKKKIVNSLFCSLFLTRFNVSSDYQYVFSRFFTKRITMYRQYLLTNCIFIENPEIQRLLIEWQIYRSSEITFTSINQNYWLIGK